MRNILIIIITCLSLSVSAQTSDSLRIKNLENDFITLSNRVNSLQNVQNQQKQKIAEQTARIEELEKLLDEKTAGFESSLNKKSSDLENTINSKIGETDSKLNQTAESLTQSISSSKLIAIIGIVAAIVLLIIVFVILRSKIGNKDSDIDKIKSAQKSLESVQKSMQEESVKLDSKLVELLDKQMTSSLNVVGKTDTTKIDHSFALKVGDEMAKIETNLSKMSPEVKGYKQLQQALKRIKDNFNAHGYEIVELLGLDYNDGMPFEAQFVPDDSLPEGKRIISGITRLQINYNGEMIQSAKIVVRQNI